ECRLAARAHADPAFYNTNNAADDLEAVRQALGYERIVLFGGSYGTFFSFVYMRRHPEHVESAVLTGVFAPGFQPLPGAPDGAQHALDDLVARCRDDRVCHRHFPKFREHFNAVLARFDRGPVPVRLKQRGSSVILRLSKEVLVDRVRQVLYDPQNAAYVPVTFELAYKGNYSALADMINGISLALAGAVNGGAFLSYTCADEIPFISAAAMADAARSSFAGDLRAKAQQRACLLWRVPTMPPSFNQPVRTDIPTLLIMGSDDPATPPTYARRALPYLKNGSAVVVQGAGHVTETACTNDLVAKFISNPTGFRITGSPCRTRYTPPPFALAP
ncbi:MAG: alpha/beta fold hydrolase, partial [Candidatus Eremiobacteraeota bacterium]|nr:alpha/beta fold hydrolase [Candidatus Eremiobacteraeota bacterium]